MSTSLTAVLAWIDAANRQDADRLAELSSPEIAIVGPRGIARGTEVLRDWLKRAGLTLENKRGFARGSAVVVEQHGVWRSGETGEITGEADVASRFEVENGCIVTFERFDNLRSALEAAGLVESDDVGAV